MIKPRNSEDLAESSNRLHEKLMSKKCKLLLKQQEE